MDIRYFQDTDTLLLVFNQNEIVSTDDVNENMLVDLDANGNPVSLTIEHAQHMTNVHGLSFQQISQGSVKQLVNI
ncbi:DUF2283 domain-containing protein [Dyadobacter chenhuakuii]|jgi:uncharacterized protein YuzE|uniref:DUF2283 domain-containing protein n=1 Tax=Dyadobacter chenhuakuii TaxID=2909339 RepID=A0ABY4XHW8_9BACT|nr:DUF2283 domain-containing protein [Dyadobacter chenhuakuii]MCF2495804.1 DUF2283 domain-containing protein [Dyadobacter chenhuakuii]USJ29835.1 DUF2283 domain-containing protein [Dyadobacter chenhuakuii]